MKVKLAFATFFVLSIAILISEWSGAGRSLWHPYYRALVGQRTHEEVIQELAPKHRSRLQASFEDAGISYPPERLTLVGLKEERALEVWAHRGDQWELVRTYPVLAASGGPGPKLREGDYQVPEGVYRLTEFNPRSSYHLSVRVDYPNADDLSIAEREGRTNLGGDIFIHGKAVSIGCLAIGDDAIEELYLLLADTGLSRTKLLLTPSAEPSVESNAPAWVSERYEYLRRELDAVR